MYNIYSFSDKTVYTVDKGNVTASYKCDCCPVIIYDKKTMKAIEQKELEWIAF